MKNYDDVTLGLQGILRSWSTGDSACWVSFVTSIDKIESVDEKFTEAYGIRLSAEKRRWRKSNGLPTAWACSLPVLADPYKRQVVLLASKEALTVKEGPFAREKWITRFPEVSDFVIVKEPRDRGDSSWTWRIQARQAGLAEKHLIALVKGGNARKVGDYANYLVRFYPMFGGVRRQLRRMLIGSRKLWDATRKGQDWPGPDPDHLPMMVGYKKETDAKIQRRSASIKSDQN